MSDAAFINLAFVLLVVITFIFYILNEKSKDRKLMERGHMKYLEEDNMRLKYENGRMKKMLEELGIKYENEWI